MVSVIRQTMVFLYFFFFLLLRVFFWEGDRRVLDAFVSGLGMMGLVYMIFAFFGVSERGKGCSGIGAYEVLCICT